MSIRLPLNYARACRLGSVAVAIATMTAQSQAATATASLGVSATVAGTCVLTAVGGTVAFGAYAPTGVNATAFLEGTGSLSANCTSALNGYITLGLGDNKDPSGSSDDAPARRMAGGGSYLSYTLYSNIARTTIWGNSSTSGYAFVGTGSAVSVPVYGRIPAGQVVPAASFSDAVVATITF